MGFLKKLGRGIKRLGKKIFRPVVKTAEFFLRSGLIPVPGSPFIGKLLTSGVSGLGKKRGIKSITVKKLVKSSFTFAPRTPIKISRSPGTRKRALASITKPFTRTQAAVFGGASFIDRPRRRAVAPVRRQPITFVQGQLSDIGVRESPDIQRSFLRFGGKKKDEEKKEKMNFILIVLGSAAGLILLLVLVFKR